MASKTTYREATVRAADTHLAIMHTLNELNKTHPLSATAFAIDYGNKLYATAKELSEAMFNCKTE